jgi:hypothetical protein
VTIGTRGGDRPAGRLCDTRCLSFALVGRVKELHATQLLVPASLLWIMLGALLLSDPCLPA